MKDVLTPLEMKSVDKNTQYNKIPTLLLMENAGAKIANYITENYPNKRKISIYSGTGGNGGDGFVIARHLLNHNYKVHLFLLSKVENIKNKDAITNWQSIEIIEQTDKNLKISKITDSTQLKPDNSDIIIDAILGTGVNGKIRQPTSSAIDTINYSPAIRISVDIPSGLNPETGIVEDKSVIANETLTLYKPKTGLTKAEEKYVGKITVLDIGIPRVSEEYVGEGDLLKIPKPRIDSHKGNNGSILIIGSNTDYIGAVVLAAKASMTQAIDLIYIVAPELSAKIIKEYDPNFIVRATPKDTLSVNDYDLIKPLIDKVDSILIGSGSGTSDDTGKLFNKIISNTDKSIVIDADALKLVDKENIKNKNVILTPHKKEFESFFDCETPESLDDKRTLLSDLSKEYSCVITLKGVTDIITSPDDYKLNKTGNQRMTMGGTGDMLAGLTTALSTKINNFESAYIATFLLGQAGDEALQDLNFNYTTEDLLNYLKKIS